MSTTATGPARPLSELISAMRRAPFGCLAEGCDTVRPTYPEIDAHMAAEHPEIP